MRLSEIPYYTIKDPKYITSEQKEYLMVISALQKSQNKKEAIKALKNGLSEPQKKWTKPEIEAWYFLGGKLGSMQLASS